MLCKLNVNRESYLLYRLPCCWTLPLYGCADKGFLQARTDAGHTLAEFHRIVEWWQPSKNGSKLSDYKNGSNKIVWLQCPSCPTCGELHQWDTTPRTLTRTGKTANAPPAG